MTVTPLIVGIGGTRRDGSSSEKALRSMMNAIASAGFETALFAGTDLLLPMYEPGATAKQCEAGAMIDAIRRCDGLIIASPGYHGSVSGMIKNALDYIEDLREDDRPYLSGRAVGCVACASGWQAAVSTLSTIRSIAHALRGWPTPMGAALNTNGKVFDETGACVDENSARQLGIVCDEVLRFSRLYRAM
jgi:FMN reductase